MAKIRDKRGKGGGTLMKGKGGFRGQGWKGSKEVIGPSLPTSFSVSF